jgi:exodeoxyribonuclease-5
MELRVKLLIDSINSEGPSISKTQSNELYNSVLNDYSDLPTMGKKMEKLKTDPYYNALQIKFAYAVTCHKAQGGQWKHVYIDAGFYGDRKMDKEFLRWLYTAFTRSTEKLYLINFPDDFFSLNVHS